MTLIDRPTVVPSTSAEQTPEEAAPDSLPVQFDENRAHRVHRWSMDEYLKLGDVGVVFGNRTELIDGEIFDVASQNNPHVACISQTIRVLIAAFDANYWITCQSTVRLPSGDVPEPDFAVRPGTASADKSYHPLPLLVVEVSDETLLYDQIVKSSLYAANQIPEYWILNVNDGHLEVHRKPVQDDRRKFGWRYSEPTIIRPPGTISPLAKPDVQFSIADMLP